MTALAPHIGSFLQEYLPRDRRASRHTTDTYAYSFQLLVQYAAERLQTRPCLIEIEDLTVQLILDFLDYLEQERGNTVRTRNVRLAAFKSFFRYLEYRAPGCLNLARQVHAIPAKRFDKPLIDYLDRSELQALLDAPDIRTGTGLRDRAMLHLGYAAGLRVSELIALTTADVNRPSLDTIRVMGKGRRERVLPLWNETRSGLNEWLRVRPQTGELALFLNARGSGISRHGFAHRLALHVATAQTKVPSMAEKRITPHVLRHTCAMHTLEATGDIRKVALWLGHASMRTTEMYLSVDPAEKLDILAAGVPPQIQKGSFNGVTDKLMNILRDARKA